MEPIYTCKGNKVVFAVFPVFGKTRPREKEKEDEEDEEVEAEE